MRPLHLIMTAFGPYADRQEINFRQFEGQNIFVITGPTGAGKTTIFDAISFALFGESSGESRESENFKSDYAAPDQLCSVDFTFLLQDKIYRVERFPKQIKLTNRGTSRMLNSEATLYLPDDSVITGPRNVDPMIVELLGISKDRFKQIAMLPQGEYKKLLYAQSKEKQEIFRKIFSTQIYMNVTKQLRQQLQELQQQISDTKNAIRLHLQQLKPFAHQIKELLSAEHIDISQLLDSMKTENENKLQEVSALNNRVKEYGKQIQALNLPLAKQINAQFDQLERLQQQERELTLQKQQIIEREKQLELAHRAKEVWIVEQQSLQWQAKTTQLQKQLQQTEERKTRLQQQFAQIKVAYQTLPQIQQKIKETTQQIKNTEDLQQIFYQKLKLEQAIESASAAQQKFENRGSIFDLLLKRMDRFTLLNRYNDQKEYLKQLYEMIQRFWEVSLVFDQTREQYDQMYTAFLQGQAGLLAAQLKEGEPCPVCGNTHPIKLAKHTEHVPTDAQLKQVRQQLDQQTEQLRQIDTTVRVILSALRREEKIGDLTEENIYKKKVLVGSYQKETDEFIYKILAEIHAIEQTLCEYPGMSRTILQDAKYTDLTFIEGKIKENQKNLTDNMQTLSLLKGQLQSLCERLAGETTQQNLTDTHQRLTEELQQLQQQEKVLSEQYQKLSIDEAKSSEAYDQTLQQYSRAQQESEQADRLLQKAWKDFGFQSEQNYHDSLLTEKQQEILSKAVGEYKEKVLLIKNRIDVLQTELQDQHRVDLDALLSAHRELEERQEQARQEWNQLDTIVAMNHEHCAHAAVLYRSISAVEQKHARVNRLYQLANGNNDAKLDFERYVLAAYFDDIIEVSNQRLLKMTGYRYHLRRKLDRGKYGQASGLDFEIIDSHTGKARDITTLSGGESFKASLALALGVADVMQMYSGGIEMNTMFIDEGFGTLDSESLDYAIQTLTELTTGNRLVGVISHMAELKERIPAHIEVSSGMSGSSVKVIV